MSFPFAVITDLHLADKEFGNHLPGVQEELWTMLDEVAELCIAEKRTLFVTGDIFEFKQPRQVSHRLVFRLIKYFEYLKLHGVSTYMIAGNHDLASDGMASLGRQPIGVLAASGAVNFLTEPIMLNSVQITPLNFEDRAEWDPEFFRVSRSKDAEYHIVLAHGMLCPDNRTYPYAFIPYSSVPSEGVDAYLYGHPHDDHGIHRVDETLYVSTGSFCRRSRVQKRGVDIAIGEIRDGKVVAKRHPLTSARPWQEMFIEVVEDFEVIIDPAMAALAKDARSLLAFEDVDYRTVLSHLSDTITKGAHDLALAYLNEAEHSLYGG